MLTFETEQSEENIKNVELFMEGFEIIIKQFGERLRMEEMADAFLAVGYDMIYHIGQHSLPGADREQLVAAMDQYNEIMMKRLKEEVWTA